MSLTSLDDQGFCGRCWLKLPRIQGLICRCGIPLKFGGDVCYTCRGRPAALTIRAAAEFRGVMRQAIYRFKYGGRKTLAGPFASLLRFAWDHSPELHSIQAIIPVPLYRKNERVRGYNQADLLAAALTRTIGRPLLPLLIRTRRTPSQVDLSRDQRQANVASAFALHAQAALIRERLQGRSFLLIDDVCTTTSTISECAKVLKRAGSGTVMALVLARDL